MLKPFGFLLASTFIFSSLSQAERMLVKRHGQWAVEYGDVHGFLADPEVEWAEQDIRYRLDIKTATASLSNDPSVKEQWSLEKSEIFSAIALGESRIASSVGSILVAVIDTGVDLAHPDLKSNLFVNSKEIPHNGIDDDRNGFVDDYQGFNFTARPDEDDLDHNNEDPTSAQDDYHHGTHVAGTIGAVQSNGLGIFGIAPKVKILPLRWMIKGSGWGSDAIAAIHYAVKMGARVINASWGGIGYSKALEEAVRAAEAKGVLFVASAGNNKSDNDTTPRHPANLRFSNVVTIADTDEKDGLAKTSNYGKNQVEIGAPGENILSTTIGNTYRKMSGTSMSAAHVSGVAALLLTVDEKLTASRLKKILIETATPVSSLQNKTVSGGKVNALAAMKRVIAEQSSTEIPFYEFGEEPLRFLANPGFVRPDRIVNGESVPGFSIQLVRLVKGKEIPVEGISFKAQLRTGGGYQQYATDQEGRVVDSQCQRSSFTVTIPMESQYFSITAGRQAYDLDLPLKCGVTQKLIFDEKSDAGEVVGIWQVAQHAQNQLAGEVGLAFWKSPIEFIWPEKGDYYDGHSVHLTHGYQWDVVSHEMGHAIYDQADIGQFGGGEHYIDRCYSGEMAISEGWASFYAGWLNFTLDAEDPGFEYMVPRRAPIRFENIPADVCGDFTNEWRVIGFLWDLIDRHEDGEKTSSSFVALWNDVKGMRASSIGILKKRLREKGWDAQSLETIWKLNFPAASATF